MWWHRISSCAVLSSQGFTEAPCTQPLNETGLVHCLTASPLQAKANRGILYVDEVNLLEDGLVDVVLDSAASGVNTVEREGISIVHPAKFIMIGSGNPQVWICYCLDAGKLPWWLTWTLNLQFKLQPMPGICMLQNLAGVKLLSCLWGSTPAKISCGLTAEALRSQLGMLSTLS